MTSCLPSSEVPMLQPKSHPSNAARPFKAGPQHEYHQLGNTQIKELRTPAHRQSVFEVPCATSATSRHGFLVWIIRWQLAQTIAMSYTRVSLSGCSSSIGMV